MEDEEKLEESFVDEIVSGSPVYEETGLKAKIAAIKNNEHVRTEFLRYLFVGFSSAAIEFTLFTLGERALHAPIVIANPIAMAFSMTYNFTMSRFWTFKDESVSAKETLRSLVYYLILYVINTSVTSFGISVLVSRAHIGSLIAKLIMMTAVVLWNFLIYRFIIFRKPSKTT